MVFIYEGMIAGFEAAVNSPKNFNNSVRNTEIVRNPLTGKPFFSTDILPYAILSE